MLVIGPLALLEGMPAMALDLPARTRNLLLLVEQWQQRRLTNGVPCTNLGPDRRLVHRPTAQRLPFLRRYRFWARMCAHITYHTGLVQKPNPHGMMSPIRLLSSYPISLHRPPRNA